MCVPKFHSKHTHAKKRIALIGLLLAFPTLAVPLALGQEPVDPSYHYYSTDYFKIVSISGYSHYDGPVWIEGEGKWKLSVSVDVGSTMTVYLVDQNKDSADYLRTYTDTRTPKPEDGLTIIDPIPFGAGPVIPENPLGTLTAMIALVSALGLLVAYENNMIRMPRIR